MRRLLTLSTAMLVLLAASGGVALAQGTLYVSPDVPTDLGPPVTTYLPWEVVDHRHASAPLYSLEITLPGRPAIDALEKMDTPDNWLISVEAPNDLAGALGGVFAEPGDVIRADPLGGAYSFFFDGSCVAGVVPPGSSIDALYLDGGDTGSLVVSFDTPTTIAGVTYQPSELVLYRPVAAPPCGWLIVGSVIDFGTALATYFPGSANVTGVDLIGSEWLVAFDIPTDVGPPLFISPPGMVIQTDGVSVTAGPFEDLLSEGAPSWAVSSQIDALACQANPGSIYDSVAKPVGLLMDKVTASTDVILRWTDGSCSSGADEYGIYEGKLATITGGGYDHVMIDCADAPPLLEEQITPSATSSYYLVVPHNHKTEGSYGFASSGAARPQPGLLADRCVEIQALLACP